MKHKIFSLGSMILTLGVLGACSPQSTPSMMNTSRPLLSAQTEMKQIEVSKINDGFLQGLAEDYTRFGNGPLTLTLAYDPNSKSYTAMKAFQELEAIKSKLSSMNVRSVLADTIKVEGEAPALMIQYDTLSAQAPQGCGIMPGLENSQTGRDIGDYRFGCSVDTMLAKQIYRPSDLAGQDHMDASDGRRAANAIEHYRVVTEREATRDLQVLERDDIQSE